MKVSVIISNYNYARYLSAAIDSVLAQTYRDIEIIVVDDGSTDNSREAIAQLQQKSPDKIKAIFQANQGEGGAFNTGFEAASGELIGFLDADDVWKPNKLQRVVEAFNSPDVVGIMHKLDSIDADGNILNSDSNKGPRLSENIAKVILDTGNAWCFPPPPDSPTATAPLKNCFPSTL